MVACLEGAESERQLEFLDVIKRSKPRKKDREEAPSYEVSCWHLVFACAFERVFEPERKPTERRAPLVRRYRLQDLSHEAFLARVYLDFLKRSGRTLISANLESLLCDEKPMSDNLQQPNHSDVSDEENGGVVEEQAHFGVQGGGNTVKNFF